METNHTRRLQGLRAHPVGVVLALSLGAAVSLGITRFAYALLLPVMRADLDRVEKGRGHARLLSFVRCQQVLKRPPRLCPNGAPCSALA